MRALVVSLVVCAHLFLVNYVHAGTFTPSKQAPHRYVYTGDVEEGDADALIKLGRGITVAINSKGGDYQEGLKLGRTTRAQRDHVVVVDAGSAAALWTIGDPHFTYLDETSTLWFHIPFIYPYGTREPELWMVQGIELQEYMAWGLGCSMAKARWYMSEMHHLREAFGIMAYVCSRRHDHGYMIGERHTHTYHWYATRADYNSVNHPYPVE